jgi:Helix-turn-helix domain
VVQIHPPQPNSSSTYRRPSTGAFSISTSFSTNNSCRFDRGRCTGLPRSRVIMHNSSNARVTLVSDRVTRRPVGQQSPLGIYRVSRGHLALPWNDFPARCEIQPNPSADTPIRVGGISRRRRMPYSELEPRPRFQTPTFQLLTERQAADLLRHSLSTLRRWRRVGRGPVFVRFGRTVLYRLEDLETFITTHCVSQKVSR